MAFSYKDAQMRVKDVENLENYLALWITIKGILDVPKGVSVEEMTEEELKACKRKYINSSEALKLMGVKVEKSK